jgi:hypothetical protein
MAQLELSKFQMLNINTHCPQHLSERLKKQDILTMMTSMDNRKRGLAFINQPQLMANVALQPLLI